MRTTSSPCGAVTRVVLRPSRRGTARPRSLSQPTSGTWYRTWSSGSASPLASRDVRGNPGRRAGPTDHERTPGFPRPGPAAAAMRSRSREHCQVADRKEQACRADISCGSNPDHREDAGYAAAVRALSRARGCVRCGPKKNEGDEPASPALSGLATPNGREPPPTCEHDDSHPRRAYAHQQLEERRAVGEHEHVVFERPEKPEPSGKNAECERAVGGRQPAQRHAAAAAPSPTSRSSADHQSDAPDASSAPTRNAAAAPRPRPALADLRYASAS